MTWGELKRKVEEAGLTDDRPLTYLMMHRNIIAYGDIGAACGDERLSGWMAQIPWHDALEQIRPEQPENCRPVSELIDELRKTVQ